MSYTLRYASSYIYITLLYMFIDIIVDAAIFTLFSLLP